MKTKSTYSLVRDTMPGCTVGRRKNGNIIIRRGYFYTHGKTAMDLQERVEQVIVRHNIPCKVVDRGTVWKAFNGGASTANQSHWWVELQPEEQS